MLFPSASFSSRVYCLLDNLTNLCSLSWHFLTDKYFSMLANYLPSHLLSDLLLYTKEQYGVLFISRTTCNPSLGPRTEGVSSIELSTLSLAPGLYENWRGYINGPIPIPSYWANTCYILAPRSVWELKGLHQWYYHYSELLSYTRYILATGLYEDWRGYNMN